MGLPLFLTSTIICPKIQPGFISYPHWIGMRQHWNEHITLSETHVGRLCNLLLLKSAMKGIGTSIITNPLGKRCPHIFYALNNAYLLFLTFHYGFHVKILCFHVGLADDLNRFATALRSKRFHDLPGPCGTYLGCSWGFPDLFLPRELAYARSRNWPHFF